LENSLVCFYHPDKPAIGLCKHCQRGLCSDCAELVNDSLACKNRHEEQVHALEEMTKQNILKSKRTRSDYLRNTIFYGTVGMLFSAFGVSQIRWLGLQAVVYAVIGLALLYAALANYLESRKYK
jgi:sulfite exporter TauE/SafE